MDYEYLYIINKLPNSKTSFIVVQSLSRVSLQLHRLQHARLPCPSLSPSTCSSKCLLSWLRHPTISSSVIPLSSCLQSFHIRVFSNESALPIRWPKYWSLIVSISPSNEYSRLISFRIDWLDLLAVQGTLKSLLQHHGSKASVLQCSAFFMVHLLVKKNMITIVLGYGINQIIL